MAEVEQTQIVTRARELDLVTGDRVHCLELSLGDEIERRHIVTPLGLKIGRTAPADLVIPDAEISRSHCMIMPKGDELLVSDLGSTNGTFVDGVRIEGVAALPVGGMLQVGNRMFKHEWRTRAELEQLEEFDRELRVAESYVKALLPPPSAEGPVRAEWCYLPSAKLGGDAFGYGQLSDELFVCYLVDVAGHGAGAAMHAVAVMNQLRQRALPNTDMAQPAEVLSTLNELFQMEDHAGFYFTIWYGIYHLRTRELTFASGGHHASYVVPAERGSAVPLRTKNVIIGAMPAMEFRQETVTVPKDASLYVFSDGVYEIIDKDDKQWSIDDFVELILAGPVAGTEEPDRLYREVVKRAQPHTLDDDFSLVVLTFD